MCLDLPKAFDNVDHDAVTDEAVSSKIQEVIMME